MCEGGMKRVCNFGLSWFIVLWGMKVGMLLNFII